MDNNELKLDVWTAGQSAAVTFVLYLVLTVLGYYLVQHNVRLHQVESRLSQLEKAATTNGQ